MMHIYVDDQLPYIAKAIAGSGTVETFSARNPPRDMKSKGTKALFVRSTLPVNVNLLHDTQVAFVGTATAGIDHIDVEYLREHGIRFASAAGCNANAVAEYVLFALRDVNVPADSTIGIVGYGNVGKRLARHAEDHGYRVIINDQPLYDEGVTFDHNHVSIQELFATSDVVSVHVPLVEDGIYSTRSFINHGLLASMKRDSYFVNTSRGEVVEERELRWLIDDGIMQAVLDVYDAEPEVNLDTVYAALISTPHIAGYTHTAKVNAAKMMCNAFQRWLKRDTPFIVSAQPEPSTYKRSPMNDTVSFRKRLVVDSSMSAFDSARKAYPLVVEELQDPFSLLF